MKKILLVITILTGVSAYSQQTSRRPAMPEEGYWVVENNRKTPKQSIVYFYTNDNVLMHRQEISGKKLNIRKRKIARQLNAALLQSITAWQRGEKNIQLAFSKQ